jgi:hypothetical protein
MGKMRALCLDALDARFRGHDNNQAAWQLRPRFPLLGLSGPIRQAVTPRARYSAEGAEIPTLVTDPHQQRDRLAAVSPLSSGG